MYLIYSEYVRIVHKRSTAYIQPARPSVCAVTVKGLESTMHSVIFYRTYMSSYIVNVAIEKENIWDISSVAAQLKLSRHHFRTLSAVRYVLVDWNIGPIYI